MTQKIIVCLGRTGDLLSILPLLHAEFKNGQRCALMAAKGFTDVLDGVGYADKIIYDGAPWELDKAMAQAWQLSSDVKCVQVMGPAELVKQHTYQPNGQEFALSDSFVKEMWRIAGAINLWKTQPPLIIDRRNKEREDKLLEGFPKKKKVILVAAGGNTAPFPSRDLLFKLLELNFQPKYQVIDLERFKAERIYDLLVLYERAHCLVACDSAPLHLAQACPDLPVVALVNDTPSLWHGTPWRANHICYIRYKDFADRAVEMLDEIENIGGFGTMKGTPAKGNRVVHVWSQYDVSEDNLERHKAACWEWQKVYSEAQNWVACRVDLRAVGKDSKTVLKDDRPFPPLKEVIRLGTFRAKDDDMLVLTRADTQFGNVKQYLDGSSTVGFARRTLRDGGQDTWHPVPDLFAFTKAWWNEHGTKLPNLIMGQDHYWPRCLMELIKANGGVELPLGTAYRARAKQPVAVVDRPSVTHNEKLAKDWLPKYGGLALFPAVSSQVETVRVNPRALFNFGYNPSIIRHNGFLLMAYRFHEKSLSTQLAMAELDENFNAIRNTQITIEGSHQQSSEDPRLFTYQGQLWLSWVDADFPSPAPTAVVKIGRLVKVGNGWTIEDIMQPACGRNDGSSVEKNFVFFEYDNAIHWIYKNTREGQTIYGPSAKAGVWYSPIPHWPWGEIRGGTAPLPYQGKLLRFFHSSLDFEAPPAHRRYFMGAAIMQPEPPFDTIAVSKSPICYGSELDDLSETERSACLAYKQKVIFPAGAVIHGDGWLVSAGCNDAECLLIKLRDKDLKL